MVGSMPDLNIATQSAVATHGGGRAAPDRRVAQRDEHAEQPDGDGQRRQVETCSL